MVNFFKTWLNPFWWFELLVLKPLALVLSAMFWLPLVVLKWGYHTTMHAWNSEWANYLKPKSLIGKWIVYPPLIWCLLPFTNTWLAAYLMYKYDVSWDDITSWPGAIWNITLDLSGIAWDLVSLGWTALMFFL